MGDNSQGQRNSPKPTNRGPAQSTRDGDYPALASYFDCFSTSFTRDLTLHPEHDFRHLQEQKNWKIGSSIYNEQRRQFLTAVVAESQSPVHAFFIGHPTFLEYDTTASPVHELSRLQRQIDGPVDHAAYDAAFLAEFHGPLDSFFREYPVLDYNPHGPPMGEFRRLVSASGWDPERAKRRENARTPESRAYRRARTAFFDAFRNEFDSLFGSDVEDFATWKSLCETLGVNPVPDTVTQCRKATRPFMVNIYDIAHHKRTGAPFHIFRSLADLKSYTTEWELYFPKARAKQSALHFLLRQITPRRRRR